MDLKGQIIKKKNAKKKGRTHIIFCYNRWYKTNKFYIRGRFLASDNKSVISKRFFLNKWYILLQNRSFIWDNFKGNHTKVPDEKC